MSIGTLTVREAAFGVYGAWRLLLLDKGGMAFFDRSAAGVGRSFLLAPILWPAFILVMAMQLPGELAAAGLLRFLVVETIAYSIGWTLFPLAMVYVAQALDRSDRWLDHIVAYNWSLVLQFGIYLPLMALAFSGALPAGLAEGLVAAAGLVVLFYHGFVARTALGVGVPAAAGVVVLDVLLSVFVSGWAASLL